MERVTLGLAAVANTAAMALTGRGSVGSGAGNSISNTGQPSSSPAALPSTPAALPTASIDSDAGMLALFEGMLRKDSAGCVVAGTGKDTMGLVWRRGFAA
jgi:hypothetical protein